MKRFIKASIRAKLIMSFLGVVLITGIASMIIGANIINSNVVGQAYEDVQTDLENAQYIYNDKIIVKHRFLNYLSSIPAFKTAIMTRDRQLINEKLSDLKRELDIDILNVTDANGRIIVRSRNFGLYGDDVTNDTFVDYVLKNGKAVYGSDIMRQEDLGKEGADLAEQARIRIIPTPKAAKKSSLYETRGMVIKAASPVFQNGRLIGVIYCAKLLNNYFELVDRFKSLVFKGEKLDGYDLGTATIFLEDVRVSTNVRTRDGQRAVGTQVSQEVFDRVFRQGKQWIDKAFVVEKWYISAYAPIHSIENRVIGILYVGVLEEKYNKMLRNTTLYFLLAIMICAILAVVLSTYLINQVLSPVKIFIDASRDIIEGRYRKININTDDEMAYLSNIFNNMVEAIHQRDEQLKERTQKQIVESEKLASLGRLASGIAHEINNPLTGILTYSSLLLEDLGDTDYEEDLRIIVNETMRCRKIVKGILDFARETKLEKQHMSLNKIIEDTLSILEKHFNFQNVVMVRSLSPSMPDVNMDINQMKSVINNLAVNAADAMPSGGKIEISTFYNKEKGSVVMEFSDSGVGISPENLGKIFDPFFTTKETGKGTGLGLAVTFGIIERHNGTISVKSEPGRGTTFTIELPVD
jgi:two-component system NtrC family sensor kinase